MHDTIFNFHVGDVATVWGVTVADFKLTETQGPGLNNAVSADRLNFTFTAPGHAAAEVSLMGYNFSSGRQGAVGVAYGQIPDGPSYVTITALPGHGLV